MRKRIVIGALAIIAVVVLALVLSQPKKGSVEYHKRAYLKARDGSKFVNNLQADWYRISGHLSKSFGRQTPAALAEMETHERALIDLEYMEERRFETRIGGRNAAQELVIAFAMNGTLRGKVIVEKPMARIIDVGTNFVVVRGARQDMPKWEAVVSKDRGRTKRKIDVLQSGN